MGIGDVFQCGGAGDYFIWVGDVSGDPMHGTGPGKFPAQGCKTKYGETAKVIIEWGLGVSTTGYINVGGRV